MDSCCNCDRKLKTIFGSCTGCHKPMCTTCRLGKTGRICKYCIALSEAKPDTALDN